MPRLRARALAATAACLFLGVTAPAALGATQFRPRVGNAMGLAPRSPCSSADLPAGELQTPVTYTAVR